MRSFLESWRRLSLIERIRWLRYLIPPFLAAWVIAYQLGLAQSLEAAYGHTVHYSVEIAFYSLVGPAATWIMLVWVEHRLQEKESLERQIRVAQKEKTSVLAEERARIARDLHDGVAQTLYFLALKTDSLRAQLSADTEISSELREMGETTRQVIREVRRTIFALRPLDWSPGEFISSLQKFVIGFAEQVGWQTKVDLDRTPVIPHALEPTVFRLIQESLNNVAKHGEASRVEVDLQTVEEGRWLHLMIRDDGRGFSPQSATNHGYGLAQMRRRVKMAGGSFTVKSEPGKGTTVIARLPIEVNTHA